MVLHSSPKILSTVLCLLVTTTTTSLVRAQTTPTAAQTAFSYAIDQGLITIDDPTEGDDARAVLTIMPGNNNVQQSNFGWRSFQLANTGGKRIAAAFIDVSSAIFSDVVFDHDGSGGDDVAKELSLDWGTTETNPVSPNNYEWKWLPKRSDPNFNPVASFDPADISENNLFVSELSDSNVESASGGYMAELLLFETFTPGETAEFSGDMDPNSLAGLKKGTVDSGSGWDVGGVSGAEMINSVVTVLFGDGSMASGTIASDGSQAGSIAVIASSLTSAPDLEYKGFESGILGTPSIEVSASPGDTVLVSLVDGMNPVVNEQEVAGGQITVDSLVSKRLSVQYADFPVNNAKSWQHVKVVIPECGMSDVGGLFDYNGITYMAVTAVVVDRDDIPLSKTSTPIRRQYSSGSTMSPVTSPVANPPTVNAPTPPSSSDCGLANFLTECRTTSQCKSMYLAATDCSNSQGGVCFCGTEVCGCNDEPSSPVPAPASLPVAAPMPEAPTAAACKFSDFFKQCTTTSQCQLMYSAATDCSNSQGGVCFCGNELCGCGDGPSDPVSAPVVSPITAPTTSSCMERDFYRECTTTTQCKSMYAGSNDCWNGGGGVCMCDGKLCGCN